MTNQPGRHAVVGGLSKPFSVGDLYLFQRVMDVHCTDGPGLRTAACTVKSADRDLDGYVSHIWCFPLDGSAPTQMTFGKDTSQSPRWSPGAARLGFISNRSGSTQVHVIPRDGGEARQVSDFPQGVSDLRWGPGGEYLIVTAAVAVDADMRGARSSAGSKVEQKKCAPEVAWRLPYKEDGVGYLLQREFHLFSVDSVTGRHVQLTDGAFDVLTFDVHSSGRIAFSRTREGRFAHCNDLWICEANGARPRKLTIQHSIVMNPRWSPDGKQIAFTGAIEDGDAEPRLWLVEVESGAIRALCPETLDVAHPDAVFWNSNGRRLTVSRAHRGRHQVVAVDRIDESIEVLVQGDHQFGVLACSGGDFVYSIDHPTLPSELWFRGHGNEAHGQKQLSDLNPWWKERVPIDAKALAFSVPDGKGGIEEIEGWLLRGQGHAGAQPLLNDVHGGPASYALLDYETNVFWHVLCARGWTVLALNAVGSASYGREFCRRLAGHWGSLDLPQHRAAIKQLQQQGLVDGRAVVTGKSYGGYLSAYATGNTDVFSAAVVMAPVGNIETHYGTSDGGYYADPFYMASKPSFDRELARQLSPVQHIEKSATPTLFMQGKDDERCPKCQSEELFVTLARSGDTEAELVLYPGETHGFLGSGAPSCREDAAQRISTGPRNSPVRAPKNSGTPTQPRLRLRLRLRPSELAVRVLLVENNAAAREQMGHILRSMPGVRIEFMASTQNGATSWLDAHPSGWDLALIDIFCRPRQWFFRIASLQRSSRLAKGRNDFRLHARSCEIAGAGGGRRCFL
jgi:dipeptidyl aminopeptidase/acylaminoacyl peptidase